jgi:hypothetical protein
MIGTAISIAIEITGKIIASAISPFARLADDGVDRVTDDNVERIID